MAEKMLIDASHPEETRVVVVRGNRIEEFDFESQHKKQLRGNIYLAKVTRVEPSLQAAFVDYGGNRHGFLAFSEIHPDYYQIPLADRQALLQAEAEDAANDPDFDSADEPETSKSKPKRQSRSKSQDKEKEKEKAGDESEAGDDAETPKSKPRRSRRGKKSSDKTAGAETDDAPTVEADAPSSVALDGSDGDDQGSDDTDDGQDDGKPTEMAADVEAEEVSEPAPRRRRKGRNDDDGQNFRRQWRLGR
jgi:ribonuclease E